MATSSILAPSVERALQHMPHSLCQRIAWNLLFLLLTGAQMVDEDYDQRGRARPCGVLQ
jgi:hypothetical protein